MFVLRVVSKDKRQNGVQSRQGHKYKGSTECKRIKKVPDGVSGMFH